MTHTTPQPVLVFPRPPDITPPRADPDDLARAIAALRTALEVEVRQARSVPTPHPPEEAFSPVGIPRSRPTWRAGAGLPPQTDKKAGWVGAAAGPIFQSGTQPPEKEAQDRRILSLYLPRFAMERFTRDLARRGEAIPDDLPMALAIEGTHGPVVHATNRAAELAGVHAGTRVVDMRALCPTLRVEYADTGGDKAALHKLMLWVRRWCPWTTTDGANGPATHGAYGIVMDTTGSDHLCGGEAALLRQIEERLSHLGLTAALAIAPTHGAAWALARFGGVRETCAAVDLTQRMAPLPVRALRLDGATVTLLQRLGLKTVGDLAAVPRISLARRFSRSPLPANPLLRLDQMLGRLAEPLNSPDDPPRFVVQTNLPEAIQDPTPHLPGLCEELCAGLFAAGYGARRVILTIYRSDGEVSFVQAATSQPTRDPKHLARLFDGKLEKIDPGFGFDLITLAASVAESLATIQTRLDGGADDGAELAKLIDRLSARFGPNTVRRPAPQASHIPERRERWAPAMAGVAETPLPSRTERPIRLFDPAEEIRVVYAVPEGPPAQFIWRRVTHRVTRFAGPERIAPEWWADKPGTRLRDYYRIEDQTGRRFWLYREGVLGDGRGPDSGNATPRWFVQGAFA